MKASYFLALAYIPLIWSVLYATVLMRSLTSIFRTLAYFLFFECGFQVLTSFLSYHRVNNLSLLFVYAPLGLMLMALFYEKVFEGRLDKRVLRTVTMAFFAFVLVDALVIEEMGSFSSHVLTVRSILLLTLSLSTVVLFLEKNGGQGEMTTALNWVNYGILIYHSSSLLLFYFGEVIIHKLPTSFSRYTWLLHSLFAFIQYTFFCIGLWKSPKKKPT